VLAITIALSGALSGCEAVLGVDDVVLDGAGGAGGAGTGEAATMGVGAGLAVSTSGTDAAASTGSGTSCLPDLPACAGAEPNAFEEPPDLDSRWTIASRRAEVKGKKLELDPDVEVAAIRSKSPVDASAACAVWISHVGSEAESVAGIAVGGALPGTDQLSIFRSGDSIGVSSAGQAGGTLALTDPDARHVLRLRFDGTGTVAADVKSEGGCYQQVGSPVATSPGQSITVFQLGDDGKSMFDDYCL